MYEDEDYQESSDNTILFSDEEVIVKLMDDIGELFKNYTYRFHPTTKPIDFIVTARPYLDNKEGYVKNIPVQVAAKSGHIIYVSTPDESRFHAVDTKRPYLMTAEDIKEQEDPFK